MAMTNAPDFPNARASAPRWRFLLFVGALAGTAAGASCAADDPSPAIAGAVDDAGAIPNGDASSADASGALDAPPSASDGPVASDSGADAEVNADADGSSCVVDAGGSPFLDDAIAIAVGTSVGCAIRQNHELVCWGNNTAGQLGIAPGTLQGSARPIALALPQDAGSAYVADVAIGTGFTCLIDSNSTVWCIGSNAVGELGRGLVGDASAVLAPVVDGAGGVLKAQSIALGRHHACAIRLAGDLVCWGANTNGELLADGSAPAPQPIVVPIGLSGAPLRVASEARALHTCAWTPIAAACWGANDHGALALPISDPGTNPAIGSALAAGGAAAPASLLAVGGDHTCALDANGALYCWGSDQSGAAGPSASGPIVTPQRIDFDGGPLEKLALGSEHTCFATQGSVYCFGSNNRGQLGSGPPDGSVLPLTSPQRVVSLDGGGTLDGVLAIAAGSSTCVITRGACGESLPGSVSCWGFAADGELGNDAGESLVHPWPVRVLAP
jgi:hypothetical protein